MKAGCLSDDAAEGSALLRGESPRHRGRRAARAACAAADLAAAAAGADEPGTEASVPAAGPPAATQLEAAAQVCRAVVHAGARACLLLLQIKKKIGQLLTQNVPGRCSAGEIVCRKHQPSLRAWQGTSLPEIGVKPEPDEGGPGLPGPAQTPAESKVDDAANAEG